MMDSNTNTYKYTYRTIPGSFLQDDPATDPATFDYASTSFGLKDSNRNRNHGNDDADDDGSGRGEGGQPSPSPSASASSIPWLRFKRKLELLRKKTSAAKEEGEGEGVQFKVLFMGRHGDGVHNAAERRYGSEAWNATWAKLDGDSHGEWLDAQLTPLGVEQARRAGAVWAAQMKLHIPLPQSYYTSPLRRCLQTAELTFGDLPLPKEKPFRATIKEMLRETMGVHTCDKRSSKSRIGSLFEEAFDRGDFAFEDGFVEADELYRPDHRETDAEIDVRLRSLLDDIFSHDRSECISLTSHSGAIASILRVVGHRPFALQTGAVIPVLVRAEKVGSDNNGTKNQ